MVNGTLSRILYVGALVLIGMIVVSATLLALDGTDLPASLYLVLTGLISFLFGSHIVPPNVQKLSGSFVADKRDTEGTTLVSTETVKSVPPKSGGV